MYNTNYLLPLHYSEVINPTITDSTHTSCTHSPSHYLTCVVTHALTCTCGP